MSLSLFAVFIFEVMFITWVTFTLLIIDVCFHRESIVLVLSCMLNSVFLMPFCVFLGCDVALSVSTYFLKASLKTSSVLKLAGFAKP